MKYRRAISAACLLLAMASTRAIGQDTSAARAADKGVLVDFQDADLRFVITALAEAGSLNVSYSELPSKRITLRMRQPVAREQILPLLRSIAQANGLTVSEEGGIVRLDAGAAGEASTPGAGATPAKKAEARLYVHRLKHARAARLAGTLQTIFGGSGRGAQSGAIAASLSEKLRETRILPYTGDSTPAVSVALGQVAASLPAQLRGEIQIVPDESTNSLLVRALPSDWAILKQAVEAMDLRPLQVLIEVTIAEVRKNRDLNLGVSAKGTYTKKGDAKPSLTGELKGATASDFVLKLTRGGAIDVDIALAALASRGDVRILSRPLILAQNNQEAKILVGSERPFVQVFRSLPTDAGVRDQVVQYRDVGTSLTILPTINPDGYVNLQVVQEVSTATSETQFGAPIISTRQASTHLFVKTGQTAVLGGLIEHQQDRTRSGIPLLSALPGLGALFGSTRTSSTTSELFLFLTPRIVQTDDDVDRVREGVRDESRLLKNEIGDLRRATNRETPAPPTPAGAPPGAPR